MVPPRMARAEADMAVFTIIQRGFAVTFQVSVFSGVLRCSMVRTNRLCLEGELAEPAAEPPLDEAILHFHSILLIF